ncbi:MAG TPA: hypothetical protein VE959_12270 [Bryobacteraceae bacterium]|nr:hypothetical protein [Bryobacteraceae bacterium]
MRFVLFFVAAALAHGQTARDPDAVLDQALARLQEMAHNLEKYVCIETVDRSYYQRVVPREAPARPEPAPACSQTAAGSASPGDPLRLESTDRVRLEVTVSRGRELHSWPGATRFDSRDVDELIRDGPVSTGAFGGYLASVFGPPGITYHYNGEQSANGKTLFEYGYRVPLEASRLEIKADAAWRPAAYEGDFQLDPQSLELERLTVRTNELPPGAAFCQAATTLDYRRVHIGDSDILLPRQSQLEIVLLNGRETRNVTTFSNCREYQAESEIVFDTSSGAESNATPRAGRGRVALTIGLPVTLALAEPIDTAAASAGDPVAAKVVTPVRRPGSTEELIPAGAVVHGRIRRVEHHLLPAPYFLIALSFNRVEVQGVLSPFAARSEANAELAKELGANLEMRETGIWFWDVGTFLFPTNKSRMVIPAGFESKWFTLATGAR